MKKRCLQRTFDSIETYINDAVEFLRKYEPKMGYFLAFSGGKDSIISDFLCKKACVDYTRGYSRTGIDPPEIVKFIKKHYPGTVFLKPKTDFFSLIKKKMPPLATVRWCCDEIKEKPGIEFKRSFPAHIVGIRAEESNKRARRPKIDFMDKFKAVTLKPIFHWTEYHVWETIEKFNLPYPSLYDEGFDRIGCVVCPFMFHKNQTKLKRHMERWPKHYRAFERAVKEWWESKPQQGQKYKTFEDYMHNYYHGFELDD